MNQKSKSITGFNDVFEKVDELRPKLDEEPENGDEFEGFIEFKVVFNRFFGFPMARSAVSLASLCL